MGESDEYSCGTPDFLSGQFIRTALDRKLDMLTGHLMCAHLRGWRRPQCFSLTLNYFVGANRKRKVNEMHVESYSFNIQMRGPSFFVCARHLAHLIHTDMMLPLCEAGFICKSCENAGSESFGAPVRYQLMMVVSINLHGKKGTETGRRFVIFCPRTKTDLIWCVVTPAVARVLLCMQV